VLVAAGTGTLSRRRPADARDHGDAVLLVVSYSKVIEAHPEGGGAYSVARPISAAGRACWPRRRSSSTTC